MGAAALPVTGSKLTAAAAALGASVTAACLAGGPSDSPENPWVGTISTEGNVITVVNEAGSVWEGRGTAVEELSIGAESGDDAHLFGRIEGIGAARGRLYVLEDQPPSVRVYDMEGNHLFDFGRRGEGPGEFNNPVTMAVDPGTSGPTGRVVVQDLSRVNLFDLDGNPVATWPYPGGLIRPIAVTDDGTVYIPSNWRERGEFFSGMMAISPDGSSGARLSGPAFDFAPWELRAEHGARTMISSVAYAPSAVWAILPSGAIVEGIRDRYRFEVRRPDGTVLVVERSAPSIEVAPEEARWLTALAASRMRAFEPGWAWTARPVPERKPAFYAFFGDRHGRIWVHRIVRTEAVAGCDPDPDATGGRASGSCWRDVFGFDVFEESTGRYLGPVDLPLDLRRRPEPAFVKDAIIAVVRDDADTLMVKRFRLELPGG